MSSSNPAFCSCHMTTDRFQNIEIRNNSLSSPQQITSGNVKLGITTVAQPTNPYLRGLSWGGTKWDWSQSSPSNYRLTYFFAHSYSCN